MIAIVTEVPRFYYTAAEELKARGLDFLSLNLKDPIPNNVKVVLTTEEESPHINFKNVVACGELRYAVDECIRILNGIRTQYNKLIIGIDPGLKPGIAVLGDNTVVLVDRLKSPEEVLNAAKRILKTYSGGEKIFRVGNGGGIYKMRILKSLQENFPYKIEVVNEEGTTPVNGTIESNHKDIIAAINIAIKTGDVLKKKVGLKPTLGEIRNLQKESRALSGTITISKKLAERVAKGEISLEDAIGTQRRRNANNG